MRAQHGFTLVELMVAIAVMAIVVGFAIPGFQSMVNSNRLASSANELIASLQTARIEAIRRNRRVVLCTSANPNAGAAARCASSGIEGWIVFVDANTDGDFDPPGDTLVRNSALDGPVEFAGETTIVYRADGLARESDGATLMSEGEVRLRIDASQPVRNVRCIDISTGGASVGNPPAHDANCS
jgi:type IV fimbrial biogenesis protein FimT